MLTNQKKPGMMERMRLQFLKMKSPFDFGENDVRLDSPAHINIPPEMARRDAAFDRAVAILHSNIFTLDDEKRKRYYMLAGLLLELCIEKTRMILASSTNHPSQFNAKEVMWFLSFLNLTIGNLIGLAGCQEEIDQSSDKLNDLLGAKAVYTFRSFDVHFSESEISLYNFLVSLLRQSEQNLKDYRTITHRNFNKSDCERYEKAFDYYNQYYGALDPAKEESFDLI